MRRVVAYISGTVASVLLSLAAFGLVLLHRSAPHPSFWVLYTVPLIIALAVVQLLVQLILFLHVGKQPPAKWNALLLVFTFFGIITIVAASIWIMGHLNYNMTPSQMSQYTTNQSSF